MSSGGLDESQPTIGHDERAADPREALGVLDLDAHTERDHEPGEVHELRVAAEGVDVELPVEAAARANASGDSSASTRSSSVRP